jgi:hypothetical protein
MSIATAERPTMTLATEEASFPWAFFVSERWTVQELLGELHEAYEICETTNRLPPSFDAILNAFDERIYYANELMHRAWILQDVVQYGYVHEDIQAAFDNGAITSIEEYTEIQMEETCGEPFDIKGDNYWARKFMDDTEALLKLSGLVYVQVNYEGVEYYDECNKGSLPNTWQLDLHNCPIAEVW